MSGSPTSSCGSGANVAASSGFLHHAELAFNLPLPSNVLFLVFTNVSGPTMSGSVDIVTAHDQPRDVATVRVTTHYNREDIYQGCNVGKLNRGDGEHGVYVSVSDWVHQQHSGPDVNLFFEMKATLPEPSDSPLVIKRFETDLRNTVQRVGDMKDKVLFQSLSLEGTNGAIHVGSLRADQARIKTSNGAIKGHFCTSRELIISTSNGKITTDVELTSIEGSKTKVTVNSTNGNIESNISLSTPSGAGGFFEASTTTTNGKVDVKFPISPLNSKLAFVGESKNGNIKLSLNPAYEGTFNLKSKESIPKVDEHQREDPSGNNRKRVISMRTEKRSVIGQVYWEEPMVQSNADGTVDVQTKNGKVVLTL